MEMEDKEEEKVNEKEEENEEKEEGRGGFYEAKRRGEDESKTTCSI